MQSTILLSVAPPEIRGRVMGLLAVSVGTMPLGILFAGFLADWLGAPTGLALVAGQVVPGCWRPYTGGAT